MTWVYFLTHFLPMVVATCVAVGLIGYFLAYTLVFSVISVIAKVVDEFYTTKRKSA